MFSELRLGEREPEGPVETILFVCTANMCRSPMAAALARKLTEPLAPRVQFASAGILPSYGRSAHEDAVIVMKKQGADLSAHSSVFLDPALEQLPDAVVTMTRHHSRVVIERRPELFERTFPLKDLVRRATATGPRQPQEHLSDYMGRVGRGRTMSDLVGEFSEEDVRDPLGGGPKAFAVCARELEVLISQMAEMMWGRIFAVAPEKV